MRLAANSLVIAAVFALSRLSAVGATDPAILEAWQADLSTNQEASVRRIAAEKLGQWGPHAVSAEPVLLRALKLDADSAVRHQAAWALGKIASGSSEAIAGLIAALSDPEWPVRYNSTLALTWIGAPALPVLSEVLKENGEASSFAKASALNVIAQISADEAAHHLPLLNQLLQDKAEAVTILALSAVAKIGTPAASTLPKVVDLLTRGTPDIQKQAVLAVRSLGPSSAAALPQLAALAKNAKARELRIEAVLTIGAVGRGQPAAMDALLACFDDKEARVREYAASTFGLLGSEAVPVLVETLKSPETRKRRLAATALGTMGREAAAAGPALAAGLGDRDPLVRLAIIGALGAAESAEPAVREALNKARDNEPPNTPLRAHLDHALSRLAPVLGSGSE